MNPIVKEHLLSALNTFIATFLTVLGTSFAAGSIEWSGAFIGALLLAAVRAAIKEVFARNLPLALGGRK